MTSRPVDSPVDLGCVTASPARDQLRKFSANAKISRCSHCSIRAAVRKVEVRYKRFRGRLARLTSHPLARTRRRAARLRPGLATDCRGGGAANSSRDLLSDISPRSLSPSLLRALSQPCCVRSLVTPSSSLFLGALAALCLAGGERADRCLRGCGSRRFASEAFPSRVPRCSSPTTLLALRASSPPHSRLRALRGSVVGATSFSRALF